MMIKRISIFVDGENFRNSICDLFPDKHRREDYLPREAKWGEFFNDIVSASSIELYSGVLHPQLVRCYWYVVGDFSSSYHHKTQKFSETSLDSKIQYYKTHASSQIGTIDQKTSEKAKHEAVKRCKQHLEKQESTLKQREHFWTSVQTEIQSRENKLEFRRFGSIRVELDHLKFGPEKGVDVKLAVDMILLKDTFDVAILVSGDSDYIPAIEALKAFGKHVVVIDFLNKNNESLPGGAKKLKEHCDATYSIPFEKAKGFLMNSEK